MIIIENYNDRMILMKMNVVILIIGYILMLRTGSIRNIGPWANLWLTAIYATESNVMAG